MTNINILKNKTSQIVKYLKILKRYQKFSKKEVETSDDIRGMVERYLYLLCQATIDLSEAFVAYKKYRQPMSARDSFDILFEERVISQSMREILRGLVGFRNILAHEYADIKYDIVYDVLQKQINDVKKFADKIKKYI